MSFKIAFRLRRKRKYVEIAPDEVLLDAHNIPRFDRDQFEGRLERPISQSVLYGIFIGFGIILIIFIVQAWKLQIVKGQEYFNRSERNILRPVPIFAGRGVISDRNDIKLAWNSPSEKALENVASTTGFAEDAVPRREYTTTTGLAHVLGYVQYPSKDNNGFYYQNDFKGVDGIEKFFDSELQGNNGSRLVEVDARGKVISYNIVRPPISGENIKLSIDSRVQSALYENIKDIDSRAGFSGGAGVIMDIHTGEVLAITSYPEFSPQIMSDKTNMAKIKSLLNDKGLPFLDRTIDGSYTPGSIVKPYIALGALNENIIEPNTIIMTTGSISIPNPYDKTKFTVFKDWKNHGALDMRHAIGMSSDAYFYIIGGGFKDQKGLGIANIDKYMTMFGFGSSMPSDSFFYGKSGIIPTPEWKRKTFNEDWYVGNTYHTSIGQYGFTVTPIQMARAVGAIANYGTLVNPTIIAGDTGSIESTIEDIPKTYYNVVHDGMLLSSTEGVSRLLNVPYMKVASKSGTAELGVLKNKVNSWVTGFWPYENPHYAFAIILERGPADGLIRSTAAMRQFLDWLHVNAPEYLK